jgi:5S rRNA maturation endonuclease (ribonuclease M5)
LGKKRTLHPMAMSSRERRFAVFAEFLGGLVKELNDLSIDGGAVLVEGKRDARALRELGYSGPLFTIAIMGSTLAARQEMRRVARQMVVLTDLDTEGRRLAARYVKFLSHEGVTPSLAQRKRLSAASRGVFLHIENLRRFAQRRGAEMKPSSGALEAGDRRRSSLAQAQVESAPSW